MNALLKKYFFSPLGETKMKKEPAKEQSSVFYLFLTLHLNVPK